MAKKKRHIDDLFKGKLQQADLPLDGSEWDKLFSELHPEKKRRFAWWWFVLPALLISGGIALYLGLKDSTSVPVSNPITHVEETSTGTQDQQKDKSVTPLEDTLDESGESQSTEDDNVDPASTNETDIRKTSEPIAGITTPNPTTGNTTSSATHGGDDASTTERHRKAFELVTMVPKRKVNVSIPWPIVQLLERKLSLLSLIEPKDSTARTNKMIDPYIGLTTGLTQFNQRISGSDPRYASYRSDNENPATLPNFGITVGAEIKKIQVSTGLSYLVKGQQASPVFRYVIYDSLPHKDVNGDTIGWAPWNHRDTTIQGLSQPKYRYLSLPVRIGKAFALGNKFEVQIGINTSFQYLVGGDGYILNSEFKPSNVQRLSDFNRLNLAYRGYLGFGYNVSDRLKLQLLTHYETDGRTMIRSNDVSQKMSGLGGNVSLQFKLKK
ncbi:MAG: hypothetical protein JJ975_01770 [Bacteroidia bacterium]|nr:hypothetical protein [Bacteroidia bacterium]